MTRWFTLLTLLLGTTLNGFAGEPTQVSFYSGSYQQLLSQAQRSQKPFFISFHTEWCGPCKKMEAETYTQPELISYIKDHFLAYKVDAEAAHTNGPVLAKRFRVQFYPTLVIFSSGGDILHRFSGFKSGSELLSVLRAYAEDLPPLAETEEAQESAYIADLGAPELEDAFEPKPEIGTQHLEITEKLPSLAEVFDAAPVPASAGVSKSEPPAAIKHDPAPTFPKDEGLFNITIKPGRHSGFGLQIGVYEDYANVIREVMKLEEKYQQNVLVNISQLNGKTVFKVVVGPFSSQQEAQRFDTIFQMKESRDGFVVNLEKY